MGDVEQTTAERFVAHVAALFNKRGLDARTRVDVLARFATTRQANDLVPQTKSAPSDRLVHRLDRYFEESDFGPDEAALALQPLLESSIDECVKRAYVKGKTEGDVELEKQLECVRTERDEALRTMKRRRSPSQKAFYFLVLLAGAVVLSIYLVSGNAGAETTVSIEYSVGEIIAALLGGTGAAAAGLAYAAKTFSEREIQRE